MIWIFAVKTALSSSATANPVVQLPPHLLKLFDSLGISRNAIRCVLEGGAENEA